MEEKDGMPRTQAKDAVSVTEGDSAKKSQRDSTTPKTYTEEEVEAKFSSQRSVLDKKIAEQEKQLKSYAGLDAERVAFKTERDKWQKERDEAEEEALSGDPESLKDLRARRQFKFEEEVKAAKLTEREANLAKRETELADIVERDKILTRTQLAAEVAVEKGVSMDAILKLAKADTREAYEAVAEVLPKTSALPVLISDSSRTNRGGMDLDNLSPREKIDAGIAKLTKK